VCNYCWKMLLNKKQSEFVQQHLHVKRCWTKSPQQRINRTVSTQRRTRVCWLVLEPSTGAVGLSTLKNHPLNFVIFPIFLLLSETHISKREFKNGHISRICSVFQVIQVISKGNFFSAEEVDLSFNSETKEHPQISNPSFWKRDSENVFLQMF